MLTLTFFYEGLMFKCRRNNIVEINKDGAKLEKVKEEVKRHKNVCLLLKWISRKLMII